MKLNLSHLKKITLEFGIELESIHLGTLDRVGEGFGIKLEQLEIFSDEINYGFALQSHSKKVKNSCR